MLISEVLIRLSSMLARASAALSPIAASVSAHDFNPHLTPINEGLPDWWAANRNVLLSLPNQALPQLHTHPGLPLPSDCLLVVGQNVHCPSIRLWGPSAAIVLGDGVSLPGGQLACGGGSLVFIGENTRSTGGAEINCRNGGVIYIGRDGLWAAGVRILSDDMHTIIDVDTGKRLNDFGGSIGIDRHVWLGLEALVMSGALIGFDSIIGARSVVRKRHFAAQTAAAGVPARVIRKGVTWHSDDLPP